MNTILQATYTNGSLISNEELSLEVEGKTVQVTLLNVETDARETVENQDEQITKVKRFLEWSKQYSAKLLPDYKFDGDEIYER